MSNNAKRPKKSSFKEQDIDVEGLANMSNMAGMLSFLDTKPEDYARLFAKAADIEKAVEATTFQALTTQVEPTQAVATQVDTTRTTTTQGDLYNPVSLPDLIRAPTTQATTTPVTTTQLESIEATEAAEHSPRPILLKSPAGFRKSVDILSHVFPPEDPIEPPSPQVTTQPTTTQATTTQVTPTRLPRPGLNPTVSLGQGRIHPLKIREAKIVQDGHTGSEQLVYDFLWRTGTPLNTNLRSIRIGRWGIANSVHISDTTAKAALKGLVEKLAIEKIGSSDNVLGFEYHIHSWGSCLTRRRERGLTHVIKSKGVVFVDPETGTPLTGYFFPGSKTSATQVTTTQVGLQENSSPTRVVAAQGHGVDADETTQVVLNRSPYNHFENQNIITTTCLREELTPYTPTDEAGLQTLIEKVKANAPDATWEELKYFVHEKAKVIQKTKVYNPFGFLLVAIPRCFESPSFTRWRESRDAEAQLLQEQQERSDRFMNIQHCRAVLWDSSGTSDEEKQAAREILEALGEGA